MAVKTERGREIVVMRLIGQLPKQLSVCNCLRPMLSNSVFHVVAYNVDATYAV